MSEGVGALTLLTPAISMCQDDHCPQRKTCRRHETSGTIPKPLRQPWLERSPRKNDDSCDLYWPVKE